MNQYEDDKQEYYQSFPQVWPDGTELTVYTTPDNRRTVLKHSSGSHIEFKNDGTVVVKAVKDLHINSSVNSSTIGDGNENSSMTNIKCESDLNLAVTGKLTISCKEFDLQADDSSKMNTSGDFVINSNNLVEKATEQVSIESAKSMYVSTGELREKVIARTSEVGTMEGSPTGGGGPTGGQGTWRFHGHMLIENTDPKGGLTIKSAGYTNILTAAERIDLTGNPGVLSPKFDPTPFGKATYTHIITPYPGPTPRGIPGSAFFSVTPGGYTELLTGPVIRKNLGPTTAETYTGPFVENYLGPKIKNVTG